MARRTLSEQQRAERRRTDRERLEHAARELLSSDGWSRWVRVRSTNGLARYSFHNQLLIALQCPEATYVAGFRTFLALNRCVRKGEKAIRILAPIIVRDRQGEPAQAPGGEPRETDRSAKRTLFRSVGVFDVAQTDPLPGSDPVPLGPPVQPVTGDSHAHLLHPLADLAAELGYSIQFRALDGTADGWCDSKARSIVVNGGLPANGRVRVLVHEIAHALGIGYRDLGREQAEVLVDTVTYVVCRSVGLDTSASSVPYVAGWGEDGALPAIRGYAETIDTVARRIETALTAAKEPDAASTPLVHSIA